MSPVQTAVTTHPPVGRPGQEYDSAFTDVLSGAVAKEAVGFGQYVVEKNDGWELPTSESDIQDYQGGVALVDNARPTGVGYVAGDAMRVMRRGRCGALTQSAMGRGGSVYVRHTTGTSSVLGSFDGAADGVNNTLMTNFRVYAPGGDDHAVVDLNPPGASA